MCGNKSHSFKVDLMSCDGLNHHHCHKAEHFHHPQKTPWAPLYFLLPFVHSPRQSLVCSLPLQISLHVLEFHTLWSLLCLVFFFSFNPCWQLLVLLFPQRSISLLYGYTTSGLSIQLLMGIWLAYSLGSLLIKLPKQSCTLKCLSEQVFHYSPVNI